jgi:predicted aminopeptidase
MQRWLAYRADAIAIITATREELDAVYDRSIGDEEKRTLKAGAFVAARAEHAAVAARYGVEGGYTRFFEDGLNNAKIGSIAAYNTHVDAFVNMIAMYDYDFAAFFAYVAELGALDPIARQDCLERWQTISADRFETCPKK